MNKQHLNYLLLDYIEGSLPQELAHEVDQAIASDIECKQQYDEYRAIVELERLAALDPPELNEDLSGSIMARISTGHMSNAKQGRSLVDIDQRHLNDYWAYRGRLLISGLSGVVLTLIVVILVLVAQDFDKVVGTNLIATNVGEGRQLSIYENNQHLNTGVDLQTVSYVGGSEQNYKSNTDSGGYRAGELSKVKLESHELYLLPIEVEGLPDLNRLSSYDSYIDISVEYNSNGELRVSTIATMVKIHSIKVNPNSERRRGVVQIELLVPKANLATVQAARILGERLILSVLTVRKDLYEDNSGRQVRGDTADNSIVSSALYDINGNLITKDVGSNAFAVMYLTDPVSGKMRRNVLTDGRWTSPNEIILTGF